VLLPPSDVVEPEEPDVTGVPDAPAAAASPPLEALPLLMTPLAAPLDTLPLVASPPVALPDELPLAGAPLATPVLPLEPEGLTEPDEPDGVLTEPEAELLLPDDPEPTFTEGVLEEHARLIVTPTQNNPERHRADMRPPQCKRQDQDGREARVNRPSEDTNTMFLGSRDVGQWAKVHASQL
jgi:hypothetical protein